MYDLLLYIVREPESGTDMKRGHRYPFLVSELFRAEVPRIVDFFFVVSDPNLPSPSLPEPQAPIKGSDKDTNKDEAGKESKAMKDEDEEGGLQRCPLLERLLSLLNTSNELNDVLAGYVAKGLQALLNKRKDDLLCYLFGFKEHITNLLRLSANKSIGDLLPKILAFDPEPGSDILSELTRSKSPGPTATSVDNLASERGKES